MMIHYMHSYCGGRLITGLYNPNVNTQTPGYCWEKSTTGWSAPSNGTNEKADPCPYLPADFVEFLQILRKFCYTHHGPENYQGMLLAVTNSEQRIAAERYLPDAGFKEAGRHSKSGYGAKCITWIGDYRKDIFPILQKVPDYTKGKVNEAKFAQPVRVAPVLTTAAIPDRPAPQPFNTVPMQSVQDQIRNRAQQTLSPSGRRQGSDRISPGEEGSFHYPR